MELSPKQKEVLLKLRSGAEIEIYIMEGNRANRYFLKGSRLQQSKITDLYDEGLLKMERISAFKAILTLTELGKTTSL